MSLLDEIKQKSNVEFCPADDVGMDDLRSLGVPNEALVFYRDSAPTRTAQIGKVRLCPISDILAENRDCVPGAYAQPCGYVVFATTVYGDAFCFDTKAPASGGISPAVLIAHDVEPEQEMKCEDFAKLAKPIAASFEDFLRAYASESLDIEPLYPS